MELVVNVDHVTVHIGEIRHHTPWRLKTFGPVSEQVLPGRETGMLMEAKLTDTQQADVEYPKPVNRKGNPAPVEDGSVAFVTSDATVATVSQDTANPFKGTIVAVGAGTAKVKIKADADLGDDVVEIFGEEIDVIVTGGRAVRFGSPVLGAPVEQP